MERWRCPRCGFVYVGNEIDEDWIVRGFCACYEEDEEED